MNRKKWSDYALIPTDRYMTKLTEEVGEVAKELSDLREDQPDSYGIPRGRKSDKQKADKRLAAMHEELDHVIFIAEQMRARIRMEREEIAANIVLLYGK